MPPLRWNQRTCYGVQPLRFSEARRDCASRDRSCPSSSSRHREVSVRGYGGTRTLTRTAPFRTRSTGVVLVVVAAQHLPALAVVVRDVNLRESR